MSRMPPDGIDRREPRLAPRRRASASRSGPSPVPTRSRLMAMTRSGQSAGSANSVAGPRWPLGVEVERQHEAFAEGGADLPPILGAARLSLPMTSVAPSGSQKAQSVTLEKPASIHSARAAEGRRRDRGRARNDCRAFDGVEVGDVEQRRAGDGEEGAGDRQGIVGGAEGASRSDGIRRAPRRLAWTTAPSFRSRAGMMAKSFMVLISRRTAFMPGIHGPALNRPDTIPLSRRHEQGEHGK